MHWYPKKKLILPLLLLLAAPVMMAYTSGSRGARPQAVTGVAGEDTLKKEKDTIIVEVGKTYGTLNKIKGWAKIESGKWANSMNRVPYYTDRYNNPLYVKYKLGEENVQYMELRDIKLNKKPYTALIISHVRGYHKDESNDMDFRYYNAADYFIFDKEEVAKLHPDSLPKEKLSSISLRVRHAGTIPYTTQASLLKKLPQDINDVYSKRHLYDTTVVTWFQFALQPVQNNRGNNIRFNTSLAYTTGDQQPKQAPFYPFDYQYFETPYYLFKVLVRSAL